jgi:hypothetical protein
VIERGRKAHRCVCGDANHQGVQAAWEKPGRINGLVARLGCEPIGFKTAPEHRRVHLHLLGRSPRATNPAWRWGEAPLFPLFVDRHDWAVQNERLTALELWRLLLKPMVEAGGQAVAVTGEQAWTLGQQAAAQMACEGKRTLV